MDNLRAQLNPAQYEAVTTINQPVLVIAGAGSGKTRVIEYRVLHLLDQGVNPQAILLLTFTRKAAKEMLGRAASHDTRCEAVEGGTFHGFAFKLLKYYAPAVNLPFNFSILDETDASDLIAKVCTDLDSPRAQTFPKKETIKHIISKSINKQLSIKTILENEYPALSNLANDFVQVAHAYQKYKTNTAYLDYDDLLLYLIKLLEVPTLREQLGSAYQYLMVDEYQDTNQLQGRITYLLAQGHGRIMAVGDDAQSIYGFRGATHANIMTFPTLFPNCKVIKLEQNYRSTQAILNLSNVVLGNMKKKFAKKMTAPDNSPGYKPVLQLHLNPYQEAQYLAEKIKAQQTLGIPLGQQAVLFRSAYISIPLQTELAKHNIPFHVYGGLKFFETAHVRDMLGYLKILVNHADELAWRRVLLLLERIGIKTAELIITDIKNCPDLTAAKELLTRKYQGTNYHQQLDRLLLTLEHNSAKDLTPGIQFQNLLNYYKPILEVQHEDWRERLNDLETLINIAAGYRSLASLLADLTLEPPERTTIKNLNELSDQEKPLTLSTIHSAKGLEWQCVYIIGLADGVLPSRFALKNHDEVEEEQRLLYVAITRAKQQLTLSMSPQNGQGGWMSVSKLSRFLDDPTVLKFVETKPIPVNPTIDKHQAVFGKIKTDWDAVSDVYTPPKKLYDTKELDWMIESLG